MASTPASSPSHFRVTLSGFGLDTSGPFSSVTGGDKTAAVRRYHQGGSDKEEVSGGPSTRADIVVSREWRRDRDAAVAKAADAKCGRARGTITQQPLDDDFNAYGKPIVFSDVLLTGVKIPDVDAEGGANTAMLQLTFAAAGDVA